MPLIILATIFQVTHFGQDFAKQWVRFEKKENFLLGLIFHLFMQYRINLHNYDKTSVLRLSFGTKTKDFLSTHTDERNNTYTLEKILEAQFCGQCKYGLEK